MLQLLLWGFSNNVCKYIQSSYILRYLTFKLVVSALNGFKSLSYSYLEMLIPSSFYLMYRARKKRLNILKGIESKTLLNGLGNSIKRT